MHHAVVGEGEELPVHRVKELGGVPLLEIGPSHGADQERITGEDVTVVGAHEGETARGVPGGCPHFEGLGTEPHHCPVGQREVHVGGPIDLREADAAAEHLLHCPGARDVIGVTVGVQRGHQIHPELADQGCVASVLAEHRIDQHRFLRARIDQQVAVGARDGVEVLANDHGRGSLPLDRTLPVRD